MRQRGIVFDNFASYKDLTAPMIDEWGLNYGALME
jgi:hypothetical protein